MSFILHIQLAHSELPRHTQIPESVSVCFISPLLLGRGFKGFDQMSKQLTLTAAGLNHCSVISL
jgi:hypothetical protein